MGIHARWVAACFLALAGQPLAWADAGDELARDVPIAFESASGVEFQIRLRSRNSPIALRLCDTPCTLRLEPGFYRIEARAPDWDPRPEAG